VRFFESAGSWLGFTSVAGRVVAAPRLISAEALGNKSAADSCQEKFAGNYALLNFYPWQ
jgi:hypothetical protein